MNAWKDAVRGNNLDHPVTKLCLVLEEDRRTPSGRIRSSKQFREHYFPYDERSCDDRIFVTMPTDVRGPIVAAWGIRGPRSAIKDTDDRVRNVVHDAFLALDIDDFLFEEGLLPVVLMRWGDLNDWWTFWRRGPITRHAMRKALETGYDLGLFDSLWFVDNLRSRGGTLEGTDVIAEGLSKAEMTDWIRAVYRGGDSSAEGLIRALGWELLANKLPDDAVLHLLDQLAEKVGLTGTARPRTEPPVETTADDSETPDRPTPVPGEPTPPSGFPAAMTPVRRSEPPAYGEPGPRRGYTATLPAVPPPMPAPRGLPSTPPPAEAEIAAAARRSQPPPLPTTPSSRPLAGLIEDDEDDDEVPGRYRVVSSRPAARPSTRPGPLPSSNPPPGSRRDG